MHCKNSKSRKNTNEHNISRRQFISTFSAATAGLLVGGLGVKNTFANLLAQATSQVAVSNISTYERASIRNAVEAMFSNLGGLSDIIKSGDTVGIKINLTGGSGSAITFQNQTGLPPGETYWTHPEILRATGELIKDAGAGQIYIVEAIYDWDSFNNFGYKDVSDYLGATFLDLNQKEPYSAYVERSVGEDAIIYNTFTQNGILNDFDCLVSLAKSKRHNGAGVTHGIKNLVGTLPLPSGLYGQGYRSVIHENDSNDGNTYSNLCRTIMDLHQASPINLVVNDAIKTVLGGEGPWGGAVLTPASFDTLIASKDPVAADAIGTQATGFDPMADDLTVPFPQSINYLKLATELGMGTYDLNNIEVIDSTPTAIETGRGSNIPTEINLSNYPNPFNMQTTFRVSLARGGFTTLMIYNMRGQRVRNLMTKSLPPGTNKLSWDGRSDRGRTVPSGLYLAVLRTNGIQKTHKIAIVK